MQTLLRSILHAYMKALFEKSYKVRFGVHVNKIYIQPVIKIDPCA